MEIKAYLLSTAVNSYNQMKRKKNRNLEKKLFTSHNLL